MERERDQKIKDINAVKKVTRLAKHGKAGFHSSKKGDRGYDRKKYKKEDKEIE
jgi:hypothetical protein